MKTLTTAQANWLYDRGLAFLEGTGHLSTRTADYDWNPTLQRYEQICGGLRIVHRLGVTWTGTRFVTCHCHHCQQYPSHCANVEVAPGP